MSQKFIVRVTVIEIKFTVKLNTTVILQGLYNLNQPSWLNYSFFNFTKFWSNVCKQKSKKLKKIINIDIKIRNSVYFCVCASFQIKIDRQIRNEKKTKHTGVATINITDKANGAFVWFCSFLAGCFLYSFLFLWFLLINWQIRIYSINCSWYLKN